MTARSRLFRGLALAAALLLAGGCGTTADVPPPGGDSNQVGVVLPMLTSPFWQSYNDYVPKMAARHGVSAMPTVNSENDPAQQVTDMNDQLNKGARGLVVAPLDSAAVDAGLKQAERRDIPVVAVDVAPETGKVEMIVRADNRAYGRKSCEYLGKQHDEGKVIQIQGDLASVNGRDRSEAFEECMREKNPDIKVLNVLANWDGKTAAEKLDGILNANPDVKGVYMQAGGIYLAPTLQTLRSKGMLHKRGSKDHITIVSNDGIPQEYEAIRKGHIDATLSQPADGYAGWAMYYMKQAMAGKKFEPGPTDHGSTVVRHRNGLLEDQLPTPLVTERNVDDPDLWGNR